MRPGDKKKCNAKGDKKEEKTIKGKRKKEWKKKETAQKKRDGEETNGREKKIR
jgi:hypothetical protein